MASWRGIREPQNRTLQSDDCAIPAGWRAMRNKKQFYERGARAFRAGVEIVAFGAIRGWQHRAFRDGYLYERTEWVKQCGNDTLQRGPYNTLDIENPSRCRPCSR